MESEKNSGENEFELEKNDVIVNSADKIHASQALDDLRKAVR